MTKIEKSTFEFVSGQTDDLLAFKSNGIIFKG